MLWLCLFTGGCAKQHAMDMPVYWWVCTLWLSLFIGGQSMGHACLLVDEHAIVYLFAGGCACYGMLVYWCGYAYYGHACLLVDVHAIGMHVYWWAGMLWPCLQVGGVHAMVCLFTSGCACYGMPVY